jgi:hypothetical protein
METFTVDTIDAQLVLDDTVETTVQDTVQDLINVGGFKKLKGKLKVSDCGLYSLSKITKGENIRDENNLIKSLPPLMSSIARGGIHTPLEVNTEGKLIDGFCRYACAIELGLENVPVLVIDIPDSEIPFHQFTTMIRSGISEAEKSKAVFSYTLKNPEIKQARVAEKFNVSTELVSRAARVIAKGETITKAVTNGIVSPTTAWSIVDNSNDKNFDHVEDLLLDRLNTNNNETEDIKMVKPNRPVTLKTLNSELVKAGLEPINKETKVNEESIKVFDKAKVIEFLETLSGEVSGDLVTISNVVGLDVWQYIQSLIIRNKKFECETHVVREIKDELETYIQYAEKGECFIQINNNEYISFNPLLAEHGLILEIENQLERVKVSKTQLNSVINKIHNNVTILNQLKFQQSQELKKKRAKKVKSNNTTMDLTEEFTEELESNIQTSILNSLDSLEAAELSQENDTEILNIQPKELTEINVNNSSDNEQQEELEEEFKDLIYEEVEPSFDDDAEIEINF